MQPINNLSQSLYYKIIKNTAVNNSVCTSKVNPHNCFYKLIDKTAMFDYEDLAILDYNLLCFTILRNNNWFTNLIKIWFYSLKINLISMIIFIKCLKQNMQYFAL